MRKMQISVVKLEYGEAAIHELAQHFLDRLIYVEQNLNYNHSDDDPLTHDGASGETPRMPE
ncbi:hypothetical protein [Alicyclobacillus acidoterrestris]|uniref:Uncharacterized protein n=1 Tax=Alicyclobacillus acidoterrestris (strain ATCC 49025 / DSM 3922 / CIP 106132 / NCIMB 13137 / GD3B) TaxID=1356854 RepID=A0A9E6ZMP6_ALIAG|nr:hypothetical protein [Alicyclobacillus acidoterrestris]UNO48374.1 hypothetical protein K1I37_17140 [Alicyclobacillus acidoterrestris]